MPVCICRKTTVDDGSFQRHQARCKLYLAHLDALSLNRRPRKRRRQASSHEQELEFPGATTSTATNEDIDTSMQQPQSFPTSLPLPFVDDNSPAAVQNPSPPPESTRVRSTRGILPGRFTDFVAEATLPLDLDEPSGYERSGSEEQPVPPLIPHVTRTAPNVFGLIREYTGDLPLRDPEDNITIEELASRISANERSGSGVEPPEGGQPPIPVPNIYSPFPNKAAFDIGKWYWSQPNKSQADFEALIRIITAENFTANDLAGINWAKINRETGDSSSAVFDNAAGWLTRAVTIEIPSGKKNVPAAEFTVNRIFVKSLVEVIRAKFQSHSSLNFHYIPYKLIWAPNPGCEQLVSGELYNSPAFLTAHAELQASPPEPECTLPRNIAALMLWSDATHLTDFGSASLWPFYLQYGNQSKYERGRPSSNAFDHIAYIQHLPQSVQQFIREFTGKAASKPLVTHCKRELMHAIWRLLLDDEFREAYMHGIVVDCSDGFRRRMYPRFFTYSADYPEKVLLLLIRDMGNCPCPRCLVKKSAIRALGTPADISQRHNGKRVDSKILHAKVSKARKLIYKQGYTVNSKLVDDLLKSESLVPTENAFSVRLGDCGLDVFTMFLPDALHEWPLGVLRQIIMHILRILQAHDKQLLIEFDSRFSQVPPFGRDAIRYFGDNVSGMKKFAARNWEDIIQCIIPVVEGLLPEPHNSIILDLLFMTAYTHGLCMLRMHTTDTLRLLDIATIEFGKHVRKFAEVTCAAFSTTELPKETAARMRRLARKTQVSSDNTSGNTRQPLTSSNMRAFSLSTYKLHSAGGHYADAIHEYGTTDSYTTQLGEVEHRRAKTGRYMRTSKKQFEEQMAAMDIRDQRIRDIEHQLHLQDAQQNSHRSSSADTGNKPDEEAYSKLDAHHVIGVSQRDYIDIGRWLLQNQGDPAVKDFFPRLQDHLLARIRGQPHSGDGFMFHEEQRAAIVFHNNRMYPHQTFHINYTTYDVRREQDLVKSAGPRQDIMLLAQTPTPNDMFHSYWFARVLGIYHVNVVDLSAPICVPQRMEFLFVRWMGCEPEWTSGFEHLRLERVGFIPAFDGNAFGFVDPNNVIRAGHLIPVFKNGRTHRLLGRSWLARGKGAEDSDWDTFYVNCFADRDLLMRHVGGAVGHRTAMSIEAAHPRILQEASNDHDASQGHTSNTSEDEHNDTDDDSEDSELES
ncbi:hypothetical protein PC9H_004535 [Pleurotus ostreatus]|uniref:Uncharacterized protein n=1 Tax=Pleurotus ostreatus TaxID=5322 RepID=A0A8H7DW66_PLEOS|nr:uncharacterized protein PC9H_004535 [Pleurotus ostreatus]KAF7432593.1 hypothetical protein PC9H_004535 [Pleurotus ostreatus]